MPNMSKQEAAALAKKLKEQQAANEQQRQEDFKEVLNAMAGFNFEEDDLSALASMLSLPDDQFLLVAGAFLSELETDYLKPESKQLLLQTFNAAGKTLEDLRDEYDVIKDSVESLPNSSLSPVKKQFFKEMMDITYNAIASIEGIASLWVNVPVQRLSPDVKLPTYAHETDSGMDVYALEDITIKPGETVLVPTGLKVAVPKGYEIQVRPKSGRCLKTKLRIANTPGTIDSGYRDEIGIIIENVDPPIKSIDFKDFDVNSPLADPYKSVVSVEYGSSYTIGKGEKFAQLVLQQVPRIMWSEVESVAEIVNDGRVGGFGSTGLQ